MAARRKLCQTQTIIKNYDPNWDSTECVVVKRTFMHPRPFKLKAGQLWISRKYLETNVFIPQPMNVDTEFNSHKPCGFIREQYVERGRNDEILWLHLRCAAALVANMRFDAAHEAFLWLKEIILVGRITYEDQQIA